MGKRTNEVGKIPTMVMEENSSHVAGELTTGNQAAGEQETRLILESAKDKAPLFALGDRAIPNIVPRHNKYRDAVCSRLGRKYSAIERDTNILKEGDGQL